jgi:hypothetical protein
MNERNPGEADMKSTVTPKLIAIGTAAALALPLTASARHHRSGDVFAGAVIGVLAGAMIASAADCNTVYVAPPPPPPPPPVYYYQAPPPPPVYYGQPRPYHRLPPPPEYYNRCRPRRPRCW